MNKPETVLWVWAKHQKMLLKSLALEDRNKIKWLLKAMLKPTKLNNKDYLTAKSFLSKLPFWTSKEKANR